jgi:chromosome segregation ATPase
MGAKVATIEQGLLVKYDVTEEAIAKLVEEFKGTTFDTPAAYEVGRKRIATIRELRGKVEDRRKDLKADSLAFGRRVDEAARLLTNKLKEIEEPLIAARNAVDEEKARIKREAEKAELLAIDAKLKADREAAEAKAKADREAEEAKAKETREAEEKRIAEAAAKLAADQARADAANRAIAEQQRLEGERIAAERAKLEADRKAAEEARAAAQKLEDDRQAELRRQQQERQAEINARETAERAAAAAPDVDKLKAFEEKVRALMLEVPVAIASEEVRSAFTWANARLLQVADTLAKFKLRGQS